MNYYDFLKSKEDRGADHGFEPIFMPDFLFDFQKAMVGYAVKKGRAALFEDCGLGKTPQLLVWSQNVLEKTNKPVLVLTPLAVSLQTVFESEKFGIEAKKSADGQITKKTIYITNYEKLHFFNPDDFSGIVCDESSCLKNASAARRKSITQFMRKVKYRLLCTATAAPNDYFELGTSSEALGYLGFLDILNRFFKNDSNNTTMRRMYGEAPKWRFRGHAEEPFWRWVCSWARAIRKPSDLGFNDDKFTLPPLIENHHVVESRKLPDGMLFAVPANTLPEQREEKKRTIKERCEKVYELVDDKEQSLIWCHLNDEGDLLEKIIPDSVQVSGKDNDDSKEEKLINFAKGNIKRLITKPKIGAWGLNFQNCSHITFFPSHSFEQKYQAIRRCWRFGQKNSVLVDVIMTEGERKIIENLKRKEKAAVTMFDNLVANMNNQLKIKADNNYNEQIEVPEWV